MEEDEGLQEVIDAGTGLLRGQAVQQQLQGPHALRHQVYGAALHRAGQEAQQTRVPQGLQVLVEKRENGLNNKVSIAGSKISEYSGYYIYFRKPTSKRQMSFWSGLNDS